MNDTYRTQYDAWSALYAATDRDAGANIRRDGRVASRRDPRRIVGRVYRDGRVWRFTR